MGRRDGAGAGLVMVVLLVVVVVVLVLVLRIRSDARLVIARLGPSPPQRQLLPRLDQPQQSLRHRDGEGAGSAALAAAVAAGKEGKDQNQLDGLNELHGFGHLISAQHQQHLAVSSTAWSNTSGPQHTPELKTGIRN